MFPSQAAVSGSRGGVCGAQCLLEISTCGREGKGSRSGPSCPAHLTKAEPTPRAPLGKDCPWKDSRRTELSGPLHSPTAQSRDEAHLGQRPDVGPDPRKQLLAAAEMLREGADSWRLSADHTPHSWAARPSLQGGSGGGHPCLSRTQELSWCSERPRAS